MGRRLFRSDPLVTLSGTENHQGDGGFPDTYPYCLSAGPASESLTLAASLFPDRHNEQRFFTRAPREIFAHLLTYKLTPQDLAE